MLPRPVNPHSSPSSGRFHIPYFMCFVDISLWTDLSFGNCAIPFGTPLKSILVSCPLFGFFCFASSYLQATASSASPVLARWVFNFSSNFFSSKSQSICFVQFIFHKRHTCLSPLGEREKECPPNVNYCELRCLQTAHWSSEPELKAENPKPEQVLSQPWPCRWPFWVAAELRG